MGVKVTISEQLKKLEQVGVVAIQYVGAANYQTREDWAVSEFRRAMQALRDDRPDDIVFREPVR